MKVEVIKVPRDKDFSEFMKETFGEEKAMKSWFFIDQNLTDHLLGKPSIGVPWVDNEARLHIPYGDIWIDEYRFGHYEQYRIHSADLRNMTFIAPKNPEEIFFLTIE